MIEADHFPGDFSIRRSTGTNQHSDRQLTMASKMLFAAAMLACTARATPVDMSREGGVSAMIVGGVSASLNEFPYIVSLQEGGSHFCGGSLLNAHTVITAGHCSESFWAEDVQVRANSVVSSSIFVHRVCPEKRSRDYKLSL